MQFSQECKECSQEPVTLLFPEVDPCDWLPHEVDPCDWLPHGVVSLCLLQKL